MVCLKPNTTQTDTIITANPTATPAVAMRIAGRDTFRLSPLSLYMRFAMNRGKFNVFIFCLQTMSILPH